MKCSPSRRNWRNQSQINLEPAFPLVKRQPCKTHLRGTLLPTISTRAPKTLIWRQPLVIRSERGICFRQPTCWLRLSRVIHPFSKRIVCSPERTTAFTPATSILLHVLPWLKQLFRQPLAYVLKQ